MDVVKKIENAAGDLAAAAVWVEAHKAEIPPYVYNAVLLLAMLRTELSKARQRASDLLALFRRELGITPKSERGPSPKPTNSTKSPLTDAERLAALKARRAKLLKEIRRYEDRLGKGRKKRQKRAAASDAPAGDKPLLSDNTVPTAAEPVAATLAPSGEAVFSGDLTNFNEIDTAMKIKREEKFSNPRGLHSVTDERTRWNFAVTTTKINLKVETVTDPRTGKSVTASTDEIGPPNSQATWSGIANTIIAIVSYAIPINRLANMLKHTAPYFTSSRLCSYLKLAAEMFAPIYTYLGEQLADADILMGDDTTARVLEVNRALKDGGELAEAKVGSLIARIGAAFGRVFDKKSGKGKKRQLNVSLIVGKSVADDPRSYIFFFRAHLGGLGDLISKILETRSPKKSALTLVSDLATTNLLASKFYKLFKIVHAGCAAHARRPFWRHRDKDQKLCYWMLSAFLVLEQIEDRIDELGRTEKRVQHYRSRYSRKVWAIILRRCESVMRGETVYSSHWKPTSKLYGACAYIVKH